MNNCFRYYVYAGLFGVTLLTGVVTALGDSQPKPVFYLPFDGKTDAAIAGGKKIPVVQKGITYAKGMAGQGANIRGKAELEYSEKGNLNKTKGTISLWFKADWNAEDLSRDQRSDWHCMFSEAWPEARRGTGALWFWFWGKSVRGDLSGREEPYLHGYSGVSKGEWCHYAMTWDGKQHEIYRNGVRASSLGDSTSPFKQARFVYDKQIDFDAFTVGCRRTTKGTYTDQVGGCIDELKVYDVALSEQQIRDEYLRLKPIAIQLHRKCFVVGENTPLSWAMTNQGASAKSFKYNWWLLDEQGRMVHKGDTGTLNLAPGKSATVTTSFVPASPACYQLVVNVGEQSYRENIRSFRPDNIYSKDKPGLKMTLVRKVDFGKKLSPDEFVSVGQSRIGTLDGVKYLETGNEIDDRFAVRIELPKAGVPYIFEWDYPDDKKRTMDVVVQKAKAGKEEYELQTGVFCGDEYRISDKILTQRCVYWARNSRDVAVIFMSPRKDAPAAVAKLRVYRLNAGLPEAQVAPAEPVDGWTRSLALYYEDPAAEFCFGMRSGVIEDMETTVDRIAAYMKWSGQNMFIYPAVWYRGMIGEGYIPRPIHPDYIDVFLAKFRANGLTFMPTINLQSFPLPQGCSVDSKTIAQGGLYNTAVMINNTGKPNPGEWHNSPPNYNPLHPYTQQVINGHIDTLLRKYGKDKAFKGIVLHMAKHQLTWFGGIKYGYNDYNIDAFEKATGIKVPVDRKDPMRGKLYYEWLTKNARKEWVDWRCAELGRWYCQIARKLQATRPDLKLGVFPYTMSRGFIKDNMELYGSPGFIEQLNRECGLDPKYLTAPNIIFGQTIFPSDYRWRQGRPQEIRNELIRHDFFRADVYDSMKQLSFPWVNMHDRYFESAIGAMKKGQRHWSVKRPSGGAPLEADWLNEVKWRVSTLLPNPNHFMESYIMPLRYGDVLGYSKGGFVIGTHGMESLLADFSRAYRALPAKKFTDIPTDSPNVKLRKLEWQGRKYFYVVNTSDQPVKVTLSFAAAPGVVHDFLAGRDRKVGSERIQIKFGPYQLKSYRAEHFPSGLSVGK